MSQVIHIKMVLDTICPWCYIGKRKLEKAIYQFKLIKPNVKFEIQYLPYQLSPYNKKTVDKTQYYIKKLGQYGLEELNERFKKITKDLGIKINFGGVISNSLNSHRLIWWSKKYNKQSQLVDQLCILYFEENKDIGDFIALAEAAEKAGLNKEEALNFLSTEEGTVEVKELLSQNSLNDITGVPHFIFNEKFSIPGAQETEVYFNVFSRFVSK